MKQLLLCLCSVLVTFFSFAQECPVVPAPVSSHADGKTIDLNDRWSVVCADSLKDAAAYLAATLYKAMDLDIARSKNKNPSNDKNILLACDNAVQKQEGYRLRMNGRSIIISARTKEGILNGINSLLQIILFSGIRKSDAVQLPCWNITDAPAHAWRGLMLDESRHFFGKDVVKKLMDMMSLYKLNRFHWHLTDETGWRIEIKRYPLLTAIGATGDAGDRDKKPQYYTQDDIREIVQYASQRGITVIPEIDMPGHASAANRSYPQFSGGGSLQHPDFTFNPGLDGTYTFLTNILKEVAELFPSRTIHIGGDEVSFGNGKWASDTAVTGLKARYHLKTNVDVEHYFIRRMADSVYKLGCIVAGWDEIADAGLEPDKTIVMWWRHDHPEQFKKAVADGYRVVACPRLPFYFDFVQSDRDKVGRRWNKAFNPSDHVYDFNIDSLLAGKKENRWIGTEAALWTEQVASSQRLYYMLFPRICAMAENAWSVADGRSYGSFEKRINKQLNYWKQNGISYYDLSLPETTPEITDKKQDIRYLDNAK